MEIRGIRSVCEAQAQLYARARVHAMKSMLWNAVFSESWPAIFSAHIYLLLVLS
jgi:hypothetical protein